jgi:hypothetical protein
MKANVQVTLANVVGVNRVTAREISRGIGRYETHESAPAVRKVIRELIAEGAPIGSDVNGYYMITEREEFEDVLESLQSRCDAIQSRIVDITGAYNAMRDSRHTDTTLDIKDRCRYFVIYIAETANIPYQAVWTMAYRKLQKLTKVDLVTLPSWYQGSILNYVVNKNMANDLYSVLEGLEGVLL